MPIEKKKRINGEKTRNAKAQVTRIVKYLGFFFVMFLVFFCKLFFPLEGFIVPLGCGWEQIKAAEE